MSHPPRVRAGVACRIVGLDRTKFNEAVASGAYPCAPGTRSGAPRHFTQDDLLPLFFFARLVDFVKSAQLAGKLACEMATIAQDPRAKDAPRIIMLKSHSDHTFVASVSNEPVSPTSGKSRQAVSYDPDHEKNGQNYPGLGRVLFSMEFYVEHARKVIAEAWAYEASVIGGESDE